MDKSDILGAALLYYISLFRPFNIYVLESLIIYS